MHLLADEFHLAVNLLLVHQAQRLYLFLRAILGLCQLLLVGVLELRQLFVVTLAQLVVASLLLLTLALEGGVGLFLLRA